MEFIWVPRRVQQTLKQILIEGMRVFFVSVGQRRSAEGFDFRVVELAGLSTEIGYDILTGQFGVSIAPNLSRRENDRNFCSIWCFPIEIEIHVEEKSLYFLLLPPPIPLLLCPLLFLSCLFSSRRRPWISCLLGPAAFSRSR
jgi:hypothetical protein